MPPAEKKWDANAERDLCVAVIMGAQDGERMRYNWPKVHSAMEALGYSFTKDAISQHFSKSIMRDFKARHGDATNGGASTPTSVPKKASSTRKRATAAKGRKKKVVSDEDDDDDETNNPFADSPLAKKVKRMQEDEEKDVKPNDLGNRKRERSATAASQEARFEDWLHAGKEEEA
ncbi:hypothetical protein N0V84_007877 [Fusarium piperis]|uniref:Uncharacterized protein n=1 Tax=Fusarium piperis TaxID=1435070 RepID=A0A9W9BKX8_9HYPO|nr:hypothetical protein N0V84_007877 [Fusarium piperis]